MHLHLGIAMGFQVFSVLVSVQDWALRHWILIEHSWFAISTGWEE